VTPKPLPERWDPLWDATKQTAEVAGQVVLVVGTIVVIAVVVTATGVVTVVAG
jgi:hypothetical protein